MIVTFYSYKGGVGRSMALVNVAELLARWGYRVIICDWDLEAPGLERYLIPYDNPWFRDRDARAKYQVALQQAMSNDGLMDLLHEYKATMTRTPHEETPETFAPTEREEPSPTELDFVKFGKVHLRRPSSRALAPPQRLNDTIRLLSAGRRDGENFYRYAEAVRGFDWTDFYEKWAGSAYIEFFRRDLVGDRRLGVSGAADVLLVDSRTGVTEQGGVCTHHLADLVVLVTAANEANTDGTLWMAETLSDKGLQALRGDRPLRVLPIESRVEVFNEKELFKDFDGYFRERLTKYLPEAITEGSEFFANACIPYVTFYSFRERIVARESREDQNRYLAQACTHLAYGIARCGIQDGLIDDRVPSDVRAQVQQGAAKVVRRPRGRVYISCASEDADMARVVARALERRAVEVRTSASIGFGSAITSSIEESIGGAASILFLIGSAGLTPWMRAELELVQKLRLASTQRPTIIPLVRFANTFLSPLLAEYRRRILPQRVDDESSFFDDLVDDLASAPSPEEIDHDARPYPGGLPFNEGDARYFFGRERETARLAAALQAATAGEVRWLRVEGASGVGTSSVIRAGLVPAIRLGRVPSIRRDSAIGYCATTGEPLVNMATALATDPAMNIAEVQSRMKTKEAFDELLVQYFHDRPLVLIIDSLDALFDQSDTTVIDRFLEMITSLLQAKLPVYVVTSNRASLSERLERVQALAPFIGKSEHAVIEPMDEAAARSAISGPALVAGATFEPTLVDRIIAVFPLPLLCPALLSEVMCNLWERRSGASVTHALFRDREDVRAIVTAAWRKLTATARDVPAIESIILLLLSGVATRLPRRRRTVVALDESKQSRFLTELADARLIVDDGKDVQISHDAVLDIPEIRAVIETNNDRLRDRAALELAAGAWIEAGKPFGGLPTGRQLKHFAKVDSGGEGVTAFLHAARVFNRVRITTWTLSAVLALLVGLMQLMPSLFPTPRRESFADVLIGLAERAATSIPPDPRTALQAALLAKRENGSPSKVKRALNLSIESSLSRTFHLDGPIVGVSVSRNNIVALATAKQVLVLDRVAQPVLRLTSEGPVADVALSRDGTRLLVVHEDRPVEIWSLPEGKGLWSTPFFSAQPVAAVSPDGSLVALYDAKRRLLCLWSIAMRRQIWSKYTLLTRVYFAPNSDQVISMEPNGAVVVWSVAQGERRSFALHHESIKAISFNEPDSLCLTTSDGVAVLWDRHRVQKRNEFPAKGGGWYAGVISPLTEAIVLANDANGLRVVDYTGNADAAKGLLGRTPAQFLAFSTKGTLAAGYLDGTLRTWHLPSSGPTPAAEIPTGRHVPFSMIAFGDDSLVAASGEYAFVVDANAYERYQKQGVDLAAFAMDRLPLYDSSIKRISH